MVSIEVQGWNPRNETIVTATGFRYSDTSSKPDATTKTLTGIDIDDVYLQFYQLNNSLRYCNGSYYKFVDIQDEIAYQRDIKKYNTFSNYYGGGVVD